MPLPRNTARLLALVALLFASCGKDPQPAARPATEPPSATHPAPAPAADETPSPAPEACSPARPPGDYSDSLPRPEGERAYRVHVPPAAGHNPLPLVLNFHGQARSAIEQETYSGLLPVADANGFILVTPEGGGYPEEWNIEGVFGGTGIDDVAAVADFLAAVESTYCVDTQRVFATGMSNGAEMASQVACRLPGVFAGVAPVAGVLFQDCEGPPVAVIAFHGTADFNVPYDDVPATIEAWASYNGCPAEPEIQRIGEHIEVRAYFGCTGAPVVLYTVEDGGHTWPGAPDDTGGVGPTTHEIDASQLIWDFFRDVRLAP